MLCTSPQLARYLGVPVSEARAQLREYHRKAVERLVQHRDPDNDWDSDDDAYYGNGSIDAYKWHRPWEINPKLAAKQAAPGDYLIGVEVERQFDDTGYAEAAARRALRWRYVAIDTEGDPECLELTFPPVSYNRYLANPDSADFHKYIQLLRDELGGHNDCDFCGTHVNVSGGRVPSYEQVEDVSNLLRNLDFAAKRDLFGRRRPYGYGFQHGGFVEFKMFQTVADPEAMTRYIRIAVECYKIMGEYDLACPMTYDALRQRLSAAAGIPLPYQTQE